MDKAKLVKYLVVKVALHLINKQIKKSKKKNEIKYIVILNIF